jgi:predicted PurR-regulated permease PerM
MTEERRLVLWIAVLTLVGVTVYLLRGALLPFVVGMAVAYLLDPVADRLERLRVPRALAAFLIVFIFLLAVVLSFVILVPILSEQVTDLVTRLPAYAETLRQEVAPMLRRIRASLTPGQAAQIDEAIKSHVGDVLGWIGHLLGGILTGGAALLSLLGLMFIMPVVAFYMIRDWDRLVAHLDSLLPEKEGATIRELAREIDDRLSGFVRGQALVCLLLGAWYATGLTLVGLDFALLVGLGAGLMSIIPYLGNIIGLGASLALAAAQYDSWVQLALVVGVFVTGQVLEGNFVTPKIVGDRVGLHPVWLLFAVTAGGALLGITGALLAVPVAAAMGVLVRFAVQRYRESPLYADSGVPTGQQESGGAAVRQIEEP